MKLFENWNKRLLKERSAERYGSEVVQHSQILQALLKGARVIRVYHQGNFFDIVLDDGLIKVYAVRTRWEDPFLVKDGEELLRLEKNWELDRGFGHNVMVI